MPFSSGKNKNLENNNVEKVNEIINQFSSSALTDEQFTVPNHLNPIVRKYYFNFAGSLNDLAQDPDLCEWTPHPAHMDIFQSKSRYKANAARADQPQGDLEQVLLIGMKMKRASSNFPFPVGFNVTGSAGNVRTGSGERFSYIIDTAEKSHSMNEIIATTDPSVNSEYIKTYEGKITPQNLRKEIVDFPGENFKFVPKDHPVIEVIKDNAEALQVNMTDAPLIDGKWYKIGSKITDRCLNELETELVSNIPLIDLNNFKGTIARPYGLGFDDPRGFLDNVTNEEKINKYMNTKYNANVIVELTYAFA